MAVTWTRTSRSVLLVLTLYITLVFVQSLFFKFTDSPETRYIFGTLDTWGASLGFPGLFAPSGIFSQYVVGSTELLASILLLGGLLLGYPLLHIAGALVSMGVISGAIFFHLTKLGIALTAVGDQGELFALALIVFAASAGVLYLHRQELMMKLAMATPR